MNGTTTPAAEQIEPNAGPKASPAAEEAYERIVALMTEIKEVVESVPHITDKNGVEALEVFFLGCAGALRGDGIARCSCQAIRGDNKIDVIADLLSELSGSARRAVCLQAMSKKD